QSRFSASARSRPWRGPRSLAGVYTSCFTRVAVTIRRSALLALREIRLAQDEIRRAQGECMGTQLMPKHYYSTSIKFVRIGDQNIPPFRLLTDCGFDWAAWLRRSHRLQPILQASQHRSPAISFSFPLIVP